MKFKNLLLMLIVMSGNVYGQDIQFPVGPSLPVPMPPLATTIVTGAQQYIIQSDKPFFVRVSRSNLAKFTAEKGPITYKGEFPDNPGVVQKKTFAGPYLQELTMLGDGEVEIFVIPSGVTDETKIQSQIITLQRKLYPPVPPIPPPIPPPVPDPPKPVPPTPVATKDLWVIFVENPLTRTPEQAAVIGDLAYLATLKTKGHDWRTYDVASATGQNYAAQITKANVTLPAVLLIDKTATTPATPLAIFTVPGTTAGIDAQITKVGGK